MVVEHGGGTDHKRIKFETSTKLFEMVVSCMLCSGG